ncbi:hypothetical protein VTN00DRAFT_1830 [Thermoascus crustaceus]|uniref:uncharacterized protein n=1 Tax=Thermoascus crustaceus TaxID=5088 RepID=UPI003743AC53
MAVFSRSHTGNIDEQRQDWSLRALDGSILQMTSSRMQPCCAMHGAVRTAVFWIRWDRGLKDRGGGTGSAPPAHRLGSAASQDRRVRTSAAEVQPKLPPMRLIPYFEPRTRLLYLQRAMRPPAVPDPLGFASVPFQRSTSQDQRSLQAFPPRTP